MLPKITALSRPVRYEEEVRPVLETRCVVCHACYDAPCQLQLSSRDGAERGASKLPVYDGTRLRETAPTRLFVDAYDVPAWRAKGFFSVSKGGGTREASSAQDSLMVEMLALGQVAPFSSGQKLPASVDLDINRTLSCPAPGKFGDYASQHPFGGMPYGTAPLSPSELRLLASWVAQGLPGSDAKALPPRAREQVRTWEAFLNGESLKQRIAARYLYEHWFLAHLYFENLPTGPFFRVVRSRTAPGEPVQEIATRRPYDDPGPEPFWYRLRPIETSIVHKTHIVYGLGPDRLARLRALFLESDWEPTRLPGYAPEEAANPFVAFDQIPARSRYQYMLDDAQYFVMTFIRGPV
ncbi:MAG: fatty acid cis/trans isomerase, partial [Myxococcota bacterium]